MGGYVFISTHLLGKIISMNKNTGYNITFTRYNHYKIDKMCFVSHNVCATKKYYNWHLVLCLSRLETYLNLRSHNGHFKQLSRWSLNSSCSTHLLQFLQMQHTSWWRSNFDMCLNSLVQYSQISNPCLQTRTCLSNSSLSSNGSVQFLHLQHVWRCRSSLSYITLHFWHTCTQLSFCKCNKMKWCRLKVASQLLHLYIWF